MAADLHIHVFEGITEKDLSKFFSNTLGSKYFAWFGSREFDEKIYTRMAETPNIWVGEVSWLKAGLFEDEETFVPDPVGKINEIIGEDLPVIDDELISKISNAMQMPNKTSYSLANADEIVEFLETNRGKSVFTVSW